MFTRKLQSPISQSTVRSIRDAYRLELKQRRQSQDCEIVAKLPKKKQGRKLLIGENLDRKVQLYLSKLREGRGTITTRIVMAATKGLLLVSNRNIPVEYGGHVQLNNHWAQALLERMGFVKRKGTKSKSKHTITGFKEVKKQLLLQIVEMEEINGELILNWCQTGLNIVPSSNWTMDKCGAKRVEIAGAKDKCQVTGVFCGTLVGDFLPI